MRDEAKGLRGRFEPAWFLNMAFYVGQQWCFWNRGRLDQPQVPKHRMLVTDNRILPVVQTRIAKKVKQRPTWMVTPQSPEDSDIDAAQLAETILEGFLWKHLHMQEKLNDVLLWADICGAGFWKIYWDSKAGDRVEVLVGQDGQPIPDQNGRLIKAAQLPQLPQGAQTQAISQGDVCIEVRSPFEVIPDPLAKSLHECEWLIEEVVQSTEYVKSRYGKDLEGDTDVSPGWLEGRFIGGFGGTTGGSAYKGVKVNEFWAKPSTQFPQGKRIVWTKNDVLGEYDNPYESLPYVMFTGVPVAGRFWPTSIVEQLRGPQVELNKIKSQIRENAQRIGNPALLRSRQANVKYTGLPGEEVLYDDTTPNSVPTYLQPPSMPAYVVQEIDRIEAAIREISGQHEVTSSQVPAGVTAASAINLLLEQDDTRLGPAIYDMEQQLGYAGQMVLRLVGKYYSDERTVQIAGDEGDWDIFGFKGEMLKDNTQVEVQAGSAFPASKAAKQAAMTQTLTLFVQNGIPLDPRALRKFFRDYQVGGLEQLIADVTNDLRQVKRENRLMYQGQPLVPNSFDDHEAHVAEHSDEMKSARYQRADPRVRQIFERHLELHKNELRAIQAQQQAQQVDQMAQAQQLQSGADMGELRLQAHFDQQAQDRAAYYKLREIEKQNRGNRGNRG